MITYFKTQFNSICLILYLSSSRAPGSTLNNIPAAIYANKHFATLCVDSLSGQGPSVPPTCQHDKWLQTNSANLKVCLN